MIYDFNWNLRQHSVNQAKNFCHPNLLLGVGLPGSTTISRFAPIATFKQAKPAQKLNELNLEEAIQICKLSAKRAKIYATSMDADDKPEKKTFQKFKDGELSKLHQTRFERQPIAPPSQLRCQPYDPSYDDNECA